MAPNFIAHKMLQMEPFMFGFFKNSVHKKKSLERY
jgi:hypothetical protein